MLAILYVHLPFELLIHEQAQYNIYSYMDGDYDISVGPPVKSEGQLLPDAAGHLILNNAPAFIADVLKIKIRKPYFNRKIQAEIDPPLKVLNRTIASILTRLKYVSRSPQVRSIELPDASWQLRYLNDDETELQREEGLLRGRTSSQRPFSYIACDTILWENVHSLRTDFEAPVWHTLLIDAQGALPHIGSAIVLASTALEVFISDVLEKLSINSVISTPVWKWINHRKNDTYKQPSVEEQYSTLLELMCGHSLLLEEAELWASFLHLKEARNKFAHEGIAKFVKSKSAALTVAEAADFISDAYLITEKVREWLPDELRWPTFHHTIDVKMGINVYF